MYITIGIPSCLARSYTYNDIITSTTSLCVGQYESDCRRPLSVTASTDG